MATMEEMSKRLRNAHTLIKDGARLSSDDDKAALNAMYRDIVSDLEAYRGLLAKTGCPKAEKVVKALIQNCADAKSYMDDELANTK